MFKHNNFAFAVLLPLLLHSLTPCCVQASARLHEPESFEADISLVQSGKHMHDLHVAVDNKEQVWFGFLGIIVDPGF